MVVVNHYKYDWNIPNQVSEIFKHISLVLSNFIAISKIWIAKHPYCFDSSDSGNCHKHDQKLFSFCILRLELCTHHIIQD